MDKLIKVNLAHQQRELEKCEERESRVLIGKTQFLYIGIIYKRLQEYPMLLCYSSLSLSSPLNLTQIQISKFLSRFTILLFIFNVSCQG